jgi:hypothetical protein
VTRLVHPGTGGEFDAPASSVPMWRRAGWAKPEDLAPAEPAGTDEQDGGTTPAQDQEM